MELNLTKKKCWQSIINNFVTIFLHNLHSRLSERSYFTTNFLFLMSITSVTAGNTPKRFSCICMSLTAVMFQCLISRNFVDSKRNSFRRFISDLFKLRDDKHYVGLHKKRVRLKRGADLPWRESASLWRTTLNHRVQDDCVSMDPDRHRGVARSALHSDR